MSSGVRQAKRTAENTNWIETFARAGYIAKGVVYLIVGILAAQAAFGTGGQVAGSKNAIREIASQPFGQTLLILTAIGLAGYALYRFVLAVKDPKNKGSDTKGTTKRIGYAASGVTNLLLAFYAVQIVMGSGGGGSSKQTYVAQLMSQPFGLWLVGILGVIVAGVGGYHIYKALNEKFMEKYNTGEMSSTERTWARRLGKWGITARGIVFGIIGVFLVRAAMTADPSKTKGLGGALQTLAEQSYGPWLLGFVALGLAAYGVYCFSHAKYRQIEA